MINSYPLLTLLMFIVLLTLKARLGGLLVRFSDGPCWPPNRMLCTSRFNVAWLSVDCVRETLYIYIWQNLWKWVCEFSPHWTLNSTDLRSLSLARLYKLSLSNRMARCQKLIIEDIIMVESIGSESEKFIQQFAVLKLRNSCSYLTCFLYIHCCS